MGRWQRGLKGGVCGWWLAVDGKGSEGELSRVAGRVGDRWGERKGKLSGRRGWRVGSLLRGVKGKVGGWRWLAVGGEGR